MATGDGGAGAAKRMAERAARMRNLTPALKLVAEEIHKATDDAFDQSRSVLGKAFDRLAPSTLAARGRRVKGGKRKTKAGKLTPGASAARSKAAGSHKPLVDTGRARNSQRAKVVGGKTIRWSAVGYLEPHMKGAGVPKRNPTVFAVPSRGKPVLLAPYARRLTAAISRYIETGRAA